MNAQSFETLLRIWDVEAEKTVQVLKALPVDKYDFRPDSGGRSLGELAWHLAEGDAYDSFGVEQRKFSFEMGPPGLERPKQIEALAPGYERVHREATTRIRKMSPEDLERKIRHFSGEEQSGEEILWGAIFHNLHHRGQLSLMCRLAGGVSPGIFGPNREEMALFQAKAKEGTVKP